MKKIITTVGTSLITNGLENGKIMQNHFKPLKNQPFSEYDNNTRIDKIKNELDKLIDTDDINLSAEISSIIKIVEQEPNEDYEIYLLATDTVLSPLCAEYIKKWFEQQKRNVEVKFEYNPNHIVKKLQVKRKKDFENEGLTNLFQQLQNIAGGYWDNIILNITGGYKAIIPYMSIVAQIYQLPAYYIFQESKDNEFELIKIPNLPITINEQLFDKYWDIIDKIAEEGTKPNDFNVLKELSSIVEEDKNSAMLTSLGYVLWEKYKERFFIFYCPDDVWEEMNRQNDIMRILKTKFYNKSLRESKTEKKQEHYVFDDGNNDNRIYYFKTENKVYIYKTFENEEEAKLYINESFDNNSIIESSKIRKIKITKN